MSTRARRLGTPAFISPHVVVNSAWRPLIIIEKGAQTGPALASKVEPPWLQRTAASFMATTSSRMRLAILGKLNEGSDSRAGEVETHKVSPADHTRALKASSIVTAMT